MLKEATAHDSDREVRPPVHRCRALRNGASWIIGLCGAALLITYGVVPTYQPTHFGRAYAAYGGVFVLLSVFWGWIIDRVTPDRFDLIGGALCLAGVALMMYWPR
jgi:small multidrug resistance family-3 protein